MCLKIFFLLNIIFVKMRYAEDMVFKYMIGLHRYCKKLNENVMSIHSNFYCQFAINSFYQH